jgi:hypothetical protein
MRWGGEGEAYDVSFDLVESRKPWPVIKGQGVAIGKVVGQREGDGEEGCEDTDDVEEADTTAGLWIGRCGIIVFGRGGIARGCGFPRSLSDGGGTGHDCVGTRK